jgi:hypothetical protein
VTDIDNMPAGPELDMRVAKVMGWHTFAATTPEWRTQLLGEGIQCVRFISHPIEVRRYEGMRFVGNWHPSTDWNDAMEAVKKLNLLMFSVHRENCEGVRYDVECYDEPDLSDRVVCTAVPTGPLAISRLVCKVAEEGGG